MLATGCFAGVAAGLFGIGGGIVVVPVLELVLGFLGVDAAIRMHIAVATSLANDYSNVTFIGACASSSWRGRSQCCQTLGDFRSDWRIAGSLDFLTGTQSRLGVDLCKFCIAYRGQDAGISAQPEPDP